MKRFLSIAGALVVSGGVAQAGEAYLHGPTSAFDWSGLYVGGYVGSIVSDDFTNTADGSITGLDGGFLAYYNVLLFDRWVVSPFVTVAAGTRSTMISGTNVDIKNGVTAGGRVGYAIGRWLPYAFYGGVWADATAGSDSNSHRGTVGGVGLDYAHGNRWVFGGRLSFLSMGEADYSSMDVGWRGTSVVGTVSFKLF